ncbi:hypothetical protein NMY22_g7124 [Coprinellus aureogranulatus]|nr:hypothetical protein NMY22_g7124 [Coprinellus aureogranulatus]
MPEELECLVHTRTVQHSAALLGEDKEKRKVKRLWLDAGSKDSDPHKDGHVFPMDAESRQKRGKDGAQTRLAPDEILRTPENPNPPTVEELDLVLEDVQGNSRMIVLVFSGGRAFNFAWLTHSSPQMYPRYVWEQSIMKVDRTKRGFKVAIAFEFEDYFLAFLSHDLVVQPEWKKLDMSITNIVERLGLGISVYRDFDEWVKAAVLWIEDRRKRSDRDGLACDVCEASPMYGQALACIQFVNFVSFLVRIPMDLLEWEVFDCPSRTGRLFEAYWVYVHKSQDAFEEFVKPAISKGSNIIAPTDEQRLKYKDKLHVFAKGRTTVPPRMADLVVEFKTRLANLEASGEDVYRDMIDDLYDPFEPTYLLDAFTSDGELKPYNFGHLIFNSEYWVKNGVGKVRRGELDDLTKMFIRTGRWSEARGAKTHLNLAAYPTLKDSTPLPNYSKPSISTFRGKKQMWSLMPPHPQCVWATKPPPPPPPPPPPKGLKKGKKAVAPKPNPPPSAPKHLTFKPWSKEDRRKLEFDWIVLNVNKVVIGPLEYCGHGKVVETPHGHIALAVFGDPRVNKYYSEQSLWPVYTGKGEKKKKITPAKLRELKARNAAPRQDPPITAPTPIPLPTTPPRKANRAPVTFPTTPPNKSHQDRFRSSPTLFCPSSPTIAALSSSPLKRKADDDKENGPPAKRGRRGASSRRSSDKHLVAAALPCTPNGRRRTRSSRKHTWNSHLTSSSLTPSLLIQLGQPMTPVALELRIYVGRSSGALCGRQATAAWTSSSLLPASFWFADSVSFRFRSAEPMNGDTTLECWEIVNMGVPFNQHTRRPDSSSFQATGGSAMTDRPNSEDLTPEDEQVAREVNHSSNTWSFIPGGGFVVLNPLCPPMAMWLEQRIPYLTVPAEHRHSLLRRANARLFQQHMELPEHSLQRATTYDPDPYNRDTQDSADYTASTSNVSNVSSALRDLQNVPPVLVISSRVFEIAGDSGRFPPAHNLRHPMASSNCSHCTILWRQGYQG